MQLRPSLAHLDVADEKKRIDFDKARRAAGEANDDDDPEPSNAQLTPLQLQVGHVPR